MGIESDYNLYGKDGCFNVKTTTLPKLKCRRCGNTDKICIDCTYTPNAETIYCLICNNCNVSTTKTSSIEKVISDWENGLTKRPLLPMYIPGQKSEYEKIHDMLIEKCIPFKYHQYGIVVDDKYYVSCNRKLWRKVGTGDWWRFTSAIDFYERVWLKQATDNTGIKSNKKRSPNIPKEHKFQAAIDFFIKKGLTAVKDGDYCKVDNKYLFSPISNRWSNLKYTKEYKSHGYEDFYYRFIEKSKIVP